MKCNVRELAHLSNQPCVLEGSLNYKKTSNGSYRNQTIFKERWFRLINNYLFYFKISDTRNPAGIFVMENSSIQMEHGQSIPFAFSISFIDEPEKKHVFAARSEDDVVQWVFKLRKCSYEYLRNRLHTLQSKIYSITGKDPLLHVPRNDGACLWAPAVPFSTTPACTVNTTSFSCHLHVNGAFTLERSKSDVQTHRYFKEELKKSSKFYTHEDAANKESKKQEKDQTFVLERSKTSGLLQSSAIQLNTAIFDNRPYSRAAPSPPARTKLSPTSRRNVISPEVKTLSEQGRHLAITGILDETPIPPRRKVSPKPLLDTSGTQELYNLPRDDDSDLIKF